MARRRRKVTLKPFRNKNYRLGRRGGGKRGWRTTLKRYLRKR